MAEMSATSRNVQTSAGIEMLKKTLELQAQQMQMINGMAQEARPAQVQPADQKSVGLGKNLDVYG
ncbi:MAG: putative motility protein [Ignavibacteriales bacterium]